MQALYSRLAEYYDIITAGDSTDTDKEVDFIKDIFVEFGVRSVLDIACGTGRHSAALAKDGYNVVGVDYADKMLKVARKKTIGSNPRFIKQNVVNLKLDQKFDAAICMWSTFGELPYRRMLTGLKKVFKSGGIFIIDLNWYGAVPVGSVHKTYNSNANGMAVSIEIDEKYKGVRRVREITNTIDGKTVKDHSEMDVLTESDLINLLTRHGFRHKRTYYDYSTVKSNDTRRMQVVFESCSESISTRHIQKDARQEIILSVEKCRKFIKNLHYYY